MSRVRRNEEFTTKLKNKNFLYFADNSSLGVILIQRGYLKYFNRRFAGIFRYTEDEVQQWKKREFYRIVHPDDLPYLVQNFKIEDNNAVSIRFRGITKDKKVFELENYICVIKFNNKNAYLSSFVPLEETYEGEEIYVPKLIKIQNEKLIILDYHPDTIELLKLNNLKFEILDHSSYREED